MRLALCRPAVRILAQGWGRVLTIFPGVTDDSVWLRALPKVIFGLDSDLIGHVDGGLPHHVAGAPYCDVVPRLSSFSPPPLDDVSQVGAKGRGGVHGLSRERLRAGVEPRPTHSLHSPSVPGTLPRSAQHWPPCGIGRACHPHTESPEAQSLMNSAACRFSVTKASPET